MSLVKPLVSVIIPCYNRASIIRLAIDSVWRQTFGDWELIIVDDGSSDNLTEALRIYDEDPRIRLVRHSRNLGEPAARNTGIAAALGRFVAFLDSDDEWLPQKLEQQLSAILAAPDPDNVFCVTQTIVMLSARHCIVRPLHGPAPGRSFGEFLYNDGGFAQSSSFLLAKSLASRFPFRENLMQMVDHLFFIELGAAGATYLQVPEPLAIWHNETRPDRVSLADSLAQWRATLRYFCDEAASMEPPHVLAACEARVLSGVLWRTDPLESLQLLARAWRDGVLSTQQVMMLLCRNTLPSRVYDPARQLYDSARHSVALLQRSRLGGALTAMAR